MSAPSAAGLLVPAGAWSLQPASAGPGRADLDLPILSQPDLMFAFIGDADAERHALSRTGTSWTGSDRAAGLKINFVEGAQHAVVSIDCPSFPIQRAASSLEAPLSRGCSCTRRRMGAQLRRSRVASLAGRTCVALVCAAPRYAGQTSGMGVKTGAACFAFWQVDASGISLWLDVRNGGNGVSLGKRTLEAATIVQCKGAPDESAFTVTQRLCRAMAEGTTVASRRGAAPTDVILAATIGITPTGRIRTTESCATRISSHRLRPQEGSSHSR